MALPKTRGKSHYPRISAHMGAAFGAFSAREEAGLAVPPPSAREALLRLLDRIGGCHVQQFSVTRQQHIGIESCQPIKRPCGLNWVVAEDARHQPRSRTISEQILVHEGVSGDDNSVIGEMERAVATRMSRCWYRYESTPWNIE